MTNHFCQESVYVPNVSKHINQIDGPIKQPTYLNRKYRARRYKWPAQQLANLPLTYGIESESMKFKHEDPYVSSSSDSSQLYMPLTNLKTTFKTTRNLHSKTWSAKDQPPPYPSGRSPPRFWRSGPVEPSCPSRDHTAFPQGGRCHICRHSHHEWEPLWSSPAGSTAPDESKKSK